MYQPKYLPNLDSKVDSISDMRFGITHTKSFIDCHSQNIDPLHMHGYMEIFFNVGKDVSFFVNDTLYHVGRYDAVVSTNNDVHMCVYNSSDTHEYFCLWIDADFNLPLFSFIKRESSCPLVTFGEHEGQKMLSCLLSLKNLSETNSDMAELTLNLYRILMQFNDANTRSKLKVTLPETMQGIIDDIRENCEYIDSVNDILKNHFISSATLTRWFRKYLHISPHEYLESQKLARALDALLNGASVTESCLKSGFTDVSYFIVRFKKKFGETPMPYVKKFK